MSDEKPVRVCAADEFPVDADTLDNLHCFLGDLVNRDDVPREVRDEAHELYLYIESPWIDSMTEDVEEVA